MVDVLRIGAWYCFLLLLAQSATAGDATTAALRRPTWLVPVAAALVVVGVAAQLAVMLRVGLLGDPVRLALFDGIALNVFGLVLRGAAVPQHAGGCALEHEAALPRTRRGIHFRPLSVRRRAAVQSRRRGCVERARPRARTRRPAPGPVDDAQPRLDVPHRVVAPRGVSLDGADRLGRLSAVHGGGGLLRPLFRRQLGARAAGRAHLRRRCWRSARWRSRARFARSCA